MLAGAQSNENTITTTTRKRAVPSIDEEGEPYPWRYGSVKGIYMSDFLTYHKNVKVDFGSRVNLVLGPNGNGKSSIVCAIILGLGGKPKILDRGDEITSFIRNKELQDPEEVQKATLMTELVGSKINGEYRRVFIVRVISRVRKESHFYLNKDGFFELSMQSEWPAKGGVKSFEFLNQDRTKSEIEMRRVPQKIITQLVNDIFKIETGNLCQFLPQTAVQNFTNCNEKDLLKRTVKSILGEDFVDEQTQLSELQREKGSGDIEFANIEARLLQMESEREILEGRVEAVKRIQMDRMRLEIMEMKMRWLKFYSTRNKYFERKKELEELEKNLLEAKKSLAPKERILAEERKKLKVFGI